MLRPSSRRSPTGLVLTGAPGPWWLDHPPPRTSSTPVSGRNPLTPGPNLGIGADRFAQLSPRMRAQSMERVLGSRPAVTPTFDKMSVWEAEAMLEGGIPRLNAILLQKGVPGVSKALHQGQVKYDRRDRAELWQSIRGLWQRGAGDCEDLALAVAAERTHAGYPSVAILHPVRPGLLHAVVRDVKSGKLLDPSRTGGMGGRAQ